MDKDFIAINNNLCRNINFFLDDRLSWSAKGILFYISDRKDDWKFSLSDLIDQSSEERIDEILEALELLEKYEYFKIFKIRKGKCQMDRMEWNFYETPITE